MNKQIIVIFFLLCNYLSADTLLETIKKDEFLSSGMVDILDFNQSKYIISVGVSKIENNSSRSIKTALLLAKLQAQSKLTKFIYDNEISTKEELLSKVEIIKDTNKTKRDKTTQYKEIIKEENGGILQNVKTVGKWRDKLEYFYVLSIKIHQGLDKGAYESSNTQKIKKYNNEQNKIRKGKNHDNF